MAKLFDVIKYEGDNKTFIYRHPCEDFNIGTQLIVHESQEAIFFMNGQALDLFGPGRHTLKTQNIPLVGKFLSRVSDDQTPFHCQVYFINKTEQMAIKWGTDSRVEYVDPTYNFPIQIGASGEMNLLCTDSRKLLVKVVGTENTITQDMVVAKFRAFLMTKVKSYLASFIRQQKLNIFLIDEHLTQMSDALLQKLAPDFSEYGMGLIHFFVTNIVKPEEDPMYQQFKELHFRQYADVAQAKLSQQVEIINQQTQAQRMVIEAQGLAQKRTTEGYSYQEERKFDVAEKIAQNEATGEFSNMGIGLGMISGIGGTVGGAVGGIVSESLGGVMGAAAPKSVCQGCGKELPVGAKFCAFCGQKNTPLQLDQMRCPSCNCLTSKGRFCMECGASLGSFCPSCNAQIPQGSKFCPECGHSVQEDTSHD